MKIKVTQEDINLSFPHHGPCPVERALKRIGIDANVGLAYIHINRANNGYGMKIVDIPNDMSQFIYTFDQLGKSGVSPKEFEIEI